MRLRPLPFAATLSTGLALLAATPAFACDRPVTPCATAAPSSLPLIVRGRPVAVVVDAQADSAVRSAADGFASDLARVAGIAATPPVLTAVPASGDMVLIGVLGESPLIDGLVKAGRIARTDVAGRWEAFRQVVVDRPFPGVARALIIVGADRRGAVFGTYDVSENIGVSPWHWWADVPVKQRRDLFITAGTRTDAPRVKYRGIFINDEEPSFGTWARTRFGGVNAKMYAHVFDLVLRLKGNYLWPAMWGKAIGADDPTTMPLADAKGIVLGTSHHEPMTRAQSEWKRDRNGGVTGGAWDYTVNGANLRTFWRGGIEQMVTGGSRRRPMEQLVTIGMRGDGDEPMSQGTAIGLLERIVADQRTIIADVTKQPANRTPQVWALYKEVQDYYDKGMKVPDDVTLLFADDNWGSVRRLPTDTAPRTGGYGIYYHFDYVGGPRSYKWINNTQVERVWQQMDLSYRRGARTLWVTNVGDLKPMEMPIDFFLKMAWNPEAMTPRALAAYPRSFAAAAFGPALGDAIGAILSDYARLSARRKPELVDASSFALGGWDATTLDGGEFGAMVAEWDALSDRVEAAKRKLSPDARDAFFELVEHPVAAMTNLYHLYYAVAWNRRLVAAGDARADAFADTAEAAFRRDKALTDAYHALAGGKWNGMMLQTKFGYTSWGDPKVDVMPPVRRVAASGTVPPIIFGRIPAKATPKFAVAEGPAFARARGGHGLAWTAIPHLGRTTGAITALPQGMPATLIADAVRVEYDLTLPTAGDATVRLYMLPTLDTRGGDGLRIGVSVDDAPVQTLTMNLKVDEPDWGQAVRNYAFPIDARFPRLAAGPHRVKIWRLDDNMLVQKVALFTGDQPSSYLGPTP